VGGGLVTAFLLYPLAAIEFGQRIVHCIIRYLTKENHTA
jgi:hypothetical protein